MSATARLAEIRAREHAATPGPWSAEDGENGDEYGEDWPVRDGFGHYICASPDDGVRGGHSQADAEFIAHAREDVPFLLAAIDAVLALHEPDTWFTTPKCSVCTVQEDPDDYPCATVRAITGEASDDGWMEEAVEHTSRLADKYRKALAPPLTGPWPVKTIDTGEV